MKTIYHKELIEIHGEKYRDKYPCERYNSIEYQQKFTNIIIISNFNGEQNKRLNTR